MKQTYNLDWFTNSCLFACYNSISVISDVIMYIKFTLVCFLLMLNTTTESSFCAHTTNMDVLLCSRMSRGNSDTVSWMSIGCNDCGWELSCCCNTDCCDCTGDCWGCIPEPRFIPPCGVWGDMYCGEGCGIIIGPWWVFWDRAVHMLRISCLTNCEDPGVFTLNGVSRGFLDL